MSSKIKPPPLKRGRKPLGADRRKQVSIRLRPSLLATLEAAASAAGRTLSAQIEAVLDASHATPDPLGSVHDLDQLIAALHGAGLAVQRVVRGEATVGVLVEVARA